MTAHELRCAKLQQQLASLITVLEERDSEVPHWMHTAHNWLHDASSVSDERLHTWSSMCVDQTLYMLYNK